MNGDLKSYKFKLQTQQKTLMVFMNGKTAINVKKRQIIASNSNHISGNLYDNTKNLDKIEAVEKY